jgi:hypothetical protein
MEFPGVAGVGDAPSQCCVENKVMRALATMSGDEPVELP